METLNDRLKNNPFYSLVLSECAKQEMFLGTQDKYAPQERMQLVSRWQTYLSPSAWR